MDDVRLVVVDSCSSQIEAEMIKGALESAGLDAIIQADSVGGMRPHVAWSSGGFRVLVREEDIDEARACLNP